jgi:hypothetical protein
MKISKKIKGINHTFHIDLIPNETKVKVRHSKSEEKVLCDLSEDFTHVLLPKGKFIFDGVELEKLKLNGQQRLDTMDYCVGIKYHEL